MVTLDIQLDDEICSALDYFEIFLERMLMCRRAAEMLGCSFKLKANGSKVLWFEKVKKQEMNGKIHFSDKEFQKLSKKVRKRY